MYSPNRREEVVLAAIRRGLLDSSGRQLAAFIDLDALALNVEALHRAFPADLEVLHAFAVKANSLTGVLRELRSLGMGAEAASQGELERVFEAGYDVERIVFDSPAKTAGELKNALSRGVPVNVDNFQELERVRNVVAELGLHPTVGVRINPQVGLGSIAAMSTAGRHSKFGVPLQDPGVREQIIAAYEAHPWLTQIHTHVGSQGIPLELTSEGIRMVVELADEINFRLGRSQIRTIDIGGGLATDFEHDSPISGFAEYVDALRAASPRLFSGDYRIITEFGRSILAKSGLIVAQVEYTKCVGGRGIVITHAGAQVATRTVFMPEAWPLRIEGYDNEGHAKPLVELREQDIAGPCCFAGDLIAEKRMLPELEPGDYVGVLDTGAYYASTHFDYNSLAVPGVYGVRRDEAGVSFSVLREHTEHRLEPTPPEHAAVYA